MSSSSGLTLTSWPWDQTFVGVTGADICPVAAVLREEDLQPPCFFSKMALTHDLFVSGICLVLDECGIDLSQDIGHSFRVRSVTMAVLLGSQESLIRP